MMPLTFMTLNYGWVFREAAALARFDGPWKVRLFVQPRQVSGPNHAPRLFGELAERQSRDPPVPMAESGQPA
jgi:hypothetical protein